MLKCDHTALNLISLLIINTKYRNITLATRDIIATRDRYTCQCRPKGVNIPLIEHQ